jgi:predicted DNA-binding transcriptional regulator AlpA
LEVLVIATKKRRLKYSTSIWDKAREAADLLRISINTLDRRVSDQIPKLNIGRRVLFRRIDIEDWIDNTSGCYERPALFQDGDSKWDKTKPSKDSFNVTAFGTSRNKSVGSEFEKALAQLTSEKRKNS